MARRKDDDHGQLRWALVSCVWGGGYIIRAAFGPKFCS